MPVTTRIITFVVRDSYKAKFATVTGRGPPPSFRVDLHKKSGTIFAYNMAKKWLTLPETNFFVAPARVAKRAPKGKAFVFQPFIFRCENVSFREGNLV